MALAALLALSALAAEPAAQPAPAAPPARIAPAGGPHAVAAAVAGGDDDEGDIPPGAPSDDYGFLAWCYGALGEYLAIYDVVKPDLKDIDKMFGSSVQEDEPYAADVAAERKALRRFAGALDTAERASPAPIAAQGAADIQAGRSIWAAAKLQPHRKLADAWLFWGIPRRCETAAKALKARAPAPGRALASAGPSAIERAAAAPLEAVQAAAAAPPAPPPPAPHGPPPAPPRAGAVLIDGQ
jgi:hypothetical protein